MKHVLIVNANAASAYEIAVHLQTQGYITIVATSSRQAIACTAIGKIGIVIFTPNLPDMPAPELIRDIRSNGYDMPIIVMGERPIDAASQGYEGVCYLSIQSEIHEVDRLVRLHTHTTTGVGLVVNIGRRSVTTRGQAVALTPLEFDLLVTLIRANGKVLSKEHLLQLVWHTGSDIRTRTVDFHVGRLRRKLAQAGIVGALRLVWGRGVGWHVDEIIVDLQD